MGVGADYVSVNESRAVAGAAMLDRCLERGVAGQRIGAVHFRKMKVGKSLHQLADVAARGADLNGNGNGVLVVFDHKEHGQLQVRSGVQRLPEFALAGSTVATGDVDDLVALENHVLELAIVAARLLGRFGMPAEVAAGLGTADCLQELRSGGRRLRDDIEFLVSPMGGHLAAAGVGVIGSSDRLQQLLVRRHAQREAERAVAIVGIEPVVAGAQRQSGSDQQCFVSGTGDLEVDLLLALEQDLAIIQLARQVHQPIDIDQLLRREPFVLIRARDGGLGRCLGGCHPIPQGTVCGPAYGSKNVLLL